MLTNLLMLAQGAPKSRGTGMESMIFFYAIFGAVIAFMFLQYRSQEKRKEREKKQMYDDLSKNDKVLTIGGIKGTVMSVKDDEVVVKVDESTNTKMTFVKSSIQRILNDELSLGDDRKK